MKGVIIAIFCISILLLTSCGSDEKALSGKAVAPPTKEKPAKPEKAEEKPEIIVIEEEDQEENNKEELEIEEKNYPTGSCEGPDALGAVRTFDEEGNKEVHRPICFGDLKIVKYDCKDDKLVNSIETCLGGCEVKNFIAACK